MSSVFTPRLPLLSRMTSSLDWCGCTRVTLIVTDRVYATQVSGSAVHSKLVSKTLGWRSKTSNPKAVPVGVSKYISRRTIYNLGRHSAEWLSAGE